MFERIEFTCEDSEVRLPVVSFNRMQIHGVFLGKNDKWYPKQRLCVKILKFFTKKCILMTKPSQMTVVNLI